MCVEWKRQRAADALARPPEELGASERNIVRTLATSLHELGRIQCEQGLPECVKSYEETLELSEKIGEKAVASNCALNLGNAYWQLAEIRDLDQADRWYRRSLKLHEELHDLLGQGRCWGSLGLVAFERFKEARAARRSTEDLLRHLNNALQCYHTALKLFPPNAIHDLATVQNALGNVYDSAGDIDQALAHYRKAIHYCEIMDELYLAGMYRYNVALALDGAGRFPDALDYAKSALCNYETYGESAAAEIQMTRELNAKIERALDAQR